MQDLSSHWNNVEAKWDNRVDADVHTWHRSLPEIWCKSTLIEEPKLAPEVAQIVQLKWSIQRMLSSNARFFADKFSWSFCLFIFLSDQSSQFWFIHFLCGDFRLTNLAVAAVGQGMLMIWIPSSLFHCLKEATHWKILDLLAPDPDDS